MYLRSIALIFLALLLPCAGCDDGTVPARGKLLIDGEPADNGRLVLNPDGDGKRLYGVVTESGDFQLFVQGSKQGAIPGTYHVLFKHQLNLSEQAQQKLERQAAGLDLNELTVSYSSPRKTPIEVPEAGIEDLVIDIRRKDGWVKIVGD